MDLVKKRIIEEANKRYEARNRGIQLLERLDLKQQYENLVIRGMRGLGDNINQRAFIKELAYPVFLDTPWPELYLDLDHVKFIECETPLRTQRKNLARQPAGRFVTVPMGNYAELKVQYGTRDLAQGSILDKISWLFGGMKPKDFGLPPFDTKFRCFQPLAVIRPATIRREWAAVSRNPDPDYLYQAAKILQEAGFYVVSICDLQPGEEWIVGEKPPANLEYHRGELSVEELLGICRYADVLVGGHGFLTHVALAYKNPMLVVMGGFGGDNSPQKVADPAFLDPSNLTFVVPDNFCKCQSMSHVCDKYISNFEDKARSWINNLKN